AAAPQRLDEARGPRVVVERLPDLKDADLQDGIADETIRPDGVEQFLLPHQPAGAVDQIAQDRVSLWSEADALLLLRAALIAPAERDRRKVPPRCSLPSLPGPRKLPPPSPKPLFPAELASAFSIFSARETAP